MTRVTSSNGNPFAALGAAMAAQAYAAEAPTREAAARLRRSAPLRANKGLAIARPR